MRSCVEASTENSVGKGLEGDKLSVTGGAAFSVGVVEDMSSISRGEQAVAVSS